MYNEEFEKIQVKIREAAYLHERVVELESLDSEHREREKEDYTLQYKLIKELLISIMSTVRI